MQMTHGPAPIKCGSEGTLGPLERIIFVSWRIAEKSSQQNARKEFGSQCPPRDSAVTCSGPSIPLMGGRVFHNSAEVKHKLGSRTT